ncbi:protein of unknown function [Streptomyces sp. DvalAA-14]|nr:protein of unknown function [Streptomyces sp. DvalAA-14]
MHVLKDAFTEGRLTLDEYEDRVGQAYRARTYQELDVLTADVPRPRPPAPGPAMRPYPYPLPPPPPRTNGKAIAALVCSLAGSGLCGVGSVVAVVLGHSAKREIAANGDDGDGLATAGLWIGYLGIASWALLFVFSVIAGS